MNQHLIDPHTDALLRAHDPAPRREDVDRGRQADVLTSILATEPESADATVAALVPRRPRPVRRLVLAGAAATVLVGASLVLPSLGGGGDTAYASWTAKPSPVSAADLAKVVAVCREKADGAGGSHGGTMPSGVPEPPVLDAADLRVRLAERRGRWVALLMTATGPDRYEWNTSCLAELPAGSDGDPEHVVGGIDGGGGFPAPTGSHFLDGGVAEFGADPGIFGSGRHEPASVTSGQIGPDVVGVTIHSGGKTVEASVKDGTYAAWWPGTAFDHSKPLPPSGEGGPEVTITYDLTLRDGRVITDAQPWRPQTTGPSVGTTGPSGGTSGGTGSTGGTGGTGSTASTGGTGSTGSTGSTGGTGGTGGTGSTGSKGGTGGTEGPAGSPG